MKGELCDKEELNKAADEGNTVNALKAAGEELMGHFGKVTGYKEKESQSSIVTAADLKSDAVISGVIGERFPGHNILSEESGFSNRGSEFTWVIDPLDGTSNFASSIPWFGILIALFESNTPVIGGAYLPVTDQLYLAEKGKGATLNGKRFRMAPANGLRNSLFSFNVDFTSDDKGAG